jgi:hypothetical protein
MKRSEMINKMQEILEMYLQDVKSKEICMAMLEMMENKGMSAPLNEDWMGLDEAINFYGNSFDSNDIHSYPRKNINRWGEE